MKLAQFFAAIAPFLEGRETLAQASLALYGTAPDELDANSLHANNLYTTDMRRLGLYGRFCRVHRFEALDGTFEQSRAALIRRSGAPAWEALVTDYFLAHPMRHAELNENGSEFPAFVARKAVGRGFPPWLPELADLEWWCFRTRIAPDDPRDLEPDSGPLRLGSTVELRPYAHDLSNWLDANDSLASAAPESPEARACVILFWRDRDLDTRSAEADPLELAILHAVVEGRSLSSAAERAGAEADALEETVADLQGAGILLGARPF